MENIKLLNASNSQPKNIIDKPVNGIYFILWNEEKSKIVYDFLEEDQVLQTGLENIFQTENKKEFILKLLEDFNIEY